MLPRQKCGRQHAALSTFISRSSTPTTVIVSPLVTVCSSCYAIILVWHRILSQHSDLVYLCESLNPLDAIKVLFLDLARA